MYIPNKFNIMTSKPSMLQILTGVVQRTGYELNCMRVGIVQSFYPEDLTADVLIVNKNTLELNKDGSQKTANHALIRAKVCYCNPYETFPLKKGDECVILFADREIESWFINGQVNPLKYQRMHDFTDAVVLVGLRSIPKMIKILDDCLNLFYGESNIAISNDHININGKTVQISNAQAMNGATGELIDFYGKKLAKVEHGIITEIF